MMAWETCILEGSRMFSLKEYSHKLTQIDTNNMLITLKHCNIADVILDEETQQRTVKIQVNEEDLFSMLDSINIKNIVKYLYIREQKLL